MFTSGAELETFPPMHPDAMRASHHQYTIAMIRNHLRFARMLRIDHVMGLHRLFLDSGWAVRRGRGLYVRYPSAEIYRHSQRGNRTVTTRESLARTWGSFRRK